jgi:hypothetical protein
MVLGEISPSFRELNKSCAFTVIYVGFLGKGNIFGD